MERIREIVWVVVCWLSAHVVLIATSVLEVALYSYLIAPGLPEEAYQAHAQQSAPYVSIVFGGPVFYAIARWLRSRGFGARAPWAVWALYTLADLAVVLAFGAFAGLLAVQWTVSQAAKALGVWLGTR